MSTIRFRFCIAVGIITWYVLLGKLGHNLYRIAIPIPIEGLKYVNVYVVKEGREAFIVDTGMGDEKIFRDFLSVLKKLEIDLKKSRIFITHFHIDHFGFAKRMLEEGAEIVISRQDLERVQRLRSDYLRDEIKDFLLVSGYPYEQEEFPYIDVVDQVYSIDNLDRVSISEDGEKFSVSDYDFTCLFCPGHSPGHMVLYDKNMRILISGDTLLKDITPAVQARNLFENPLSLYLESILRIASLEITHVLPAHGNLFINARERIREIYDHHLKRLEEVISAIEAGRRTLYEISFGIRWDTDSGDFLELPFQHRIFAMGEALAHVNYLVEKKRLTLEDISPPWTFRTFGDNN